MLHKIKFASFALCAGFASLTFSGHAQTAPDPARDLSSIPLLEFSGPRTYRFAIDYNQANGMGTITQRQRVTGDYTCGLPDKEVVWHDVAIATAPGAPAQSDI